MYFTRAIDAELAEWSTSPLRKPLVLRGARQTGKTAAVRQLGRGFELFLELNLERFEDRRLVDGCNSVSDLLAAIRSRANITHFPGQTLLFIDEIQQSRSGMGWLRFLHEDYPNLAVVAAGSLLEVRLQETGFPFPVGRVTFRYLRPFSFLEFAAALGKNVLARQIREAASALSALPTSVHEQAMDLVRDYMLVGGMPEAVVRWANEHSSVAVRRVHGDLIQAFAEDLIKYQGKGDRGHLEAAFDHLRHHYGLRFKHENFAPGYRSDLMKSALARLEGAMLIRRVWPTNSTSTPFQTRSRAAPKLLPLDVGLALATMGTPLTELRGSRLDTLVDGRVAEIFVGQQLLSEQIRTDPPMHFWITESPSANAEIDYLIAGPAGTRAIEVKSGAQGSLKSLHLFLSRAGLPTGYRLCTGAMSVEQHQIRMSGGMLDMRLVSIPLYCAELAGSIA